MGSRSARRLALVVVSLVAAACARAGTGPLQDGSPTPAAGSPDDPVIAAVGDIACSSLPDGREKRCRYDAVAKLLVEGDYDKFLALGDLQYLRGGYANFLRYYDRYLGAVKDITAPVPGNHETYTRFMNGYLRYFGEPVFTKGDYVTNGGFYSLDMGDWHLVALNTQLCRGNTWDWATGGRTQITRSQADREGCGPGDTMYEWLKADLATHPAECTLVFYHHPLLVWNEWNELPFWPGPFYYQMLPLWGLMQEHDVDVVLNGHYHNYQRFGPQDAYGRPVEEGITEIIAGMGGSTHEFFPKKYDSPAAYVTGTDESFGILEMTLHPGSWDFRFVPAEGEPAFEDSGSGDCH